MYRYSVILKLFVKIIKRAKLQQELNQLRQHFTNLVLEHKDQEQQLRKEKLKHETNVEGLLGRYDDDMTKKQVIIPYDFVLNSKLDF